MPETKIATKKNWNRKTAEQFRVSEGSPVDWAMDTSCLWWVGIVEKVGLSLECKREGLMDGDSSDDGYGKNEEWFRMMGMKQEVDMGHRQGDASQNEQFVVFKWG